MIEQSPAFNNMVQMTPQSSQRIEELEAEVALLRRQYELQIATLEQHAETARRRASEMELVYRITSGLSNRIDQQEILDLASQELVRLFWADHTGTVLFDEDRQWGTVVAEYPPHNAVGIRIPFANNLLHDELLQTRRPVCICSIATDPRAQASRETFQQLGIVSLTVVPLISRDRVIGSISLDSFTQREFTAEEQELFLTVATSIATAIENAHLFAAEQSARRTADTLREVARVLSSSFDPNEVLHLILRELQRVVLYDTASIMLLDGRLLRIAACGGWDEAVAPRGMAFPVNDCGAGEVVQQRQTIIIPDTRLDASWTRRNIGGHIRSWMGVPLIAKGVVLGVLNIDSLQPDHFRERDAEVARIFANQAAVALENARLYQESVTRVEQELAIARRIQSNLFPRTLPQVAGMTLAGRCIPARETGGDFYDVVVLGDRRLALMIGDVSGKSIPAAMLMAVARSITRSEARDHEDPTTVMRETNRWIVRDVPPLTFVALAYATIDMHTHRLALSNAGQLTPLYLRPNGEMIYLEPPPPRLPMGVMEDMPYQSLELGLSAGDLLIFYTDGIIEAHNSDNDMFGFERFEALLREVARLSPAAIIDHVLQTVQTFAGDTPQHDDITLVVMRIEE